MRLGDTLARNSPINWHPMFFSPHFSNEALRTRLHGRFFQTFCCFALPLIGAALNTASLHAGWLAFRNDLPGPVLVQEAIVTGQGIPVLGQPHRLYPGDVWQEFLLQACTMEILVADSKKPNQVIHQETIQVSGDQFYVLQLDSRRKIKLVPSKFPSRQPHHPSRP